MSDATISLVILAAVVVLFVWNRLPVEFVAVGSALALYFTGVLTLPEALAGFGDPAVILIAALFVVSEGLDGTGVTAWVGQALVNKSGDSTRRLLLLTMLLSAGLTALIGLNGTVAALLPMAVVMAMRRTFPPSQLLIPLAFAGSAGGMLLLTGSPVNVVISEAALDAGVGEFGFAEFALAGIPLVIGTVAIVLLFGRPPVASSGQSDAAAGPQSARGDAGGSLLAGQRLPPAGVVGFRAHRFPPGPMGTHGYPGISVITVLDAVAQRPVSSGEIGPGDRITVLGDSDVAQRFAADQQLRVEAIRSGADIEESLFDRESGAAEVVIPPRSRFEGRTVQPGQVMGDGRLIVLAVQRQGKDRGSAPTELRVGDVLLVEGGWRPLEERAGEP